MYSFQAFLLGGAKEVRFWEEVEVALVLEEEGRRDKNQLFLRVVDLELEVALREEVAVVVVFVFMEEGTRREEEEEGRDDLILVLLA